MKKSLGGLMVVLIFICVVSYKSFQTTQVKIIPANHGNKTTSIADPLPPKTEKSSGSPVIGLTDIQTSVPIPISPPAPVVSSGSKPILDINFSQYSDINSFLADPVWDNIERYNSKEMQIVSDETDPSVPSSKTLRYHYNHGNDGCSSITVENSLPIPGGARQEVWAEFRVKWSANFTTDQPLCYPNDHKFIFGDTEGEDTGRWGLYVGADESPTHSIHIERPWGFPISKTYETGTTPDTGEGGPYMLGLGGSKPISNKIVANDVWDGKWHSIRLYFRNSTSSMSNDGIMKVWIDRVLYHDETNFNTFKKDGTREMITGFSFNHNQDDGPLNRDMYIWWSQIRYYANNPGW